TFTGRLRPAFLVPGCPRYTFLTYQRSPTDVTSPPNTSVSSALISSSTLTGRLRGRQSKSP
ncbi:MAG: hypothetical protein E6534_10340, partial [Corynebacterium kroppenstedtii]|nr:hypothetical protein [Corynebacterium kroppenstedtii]